MADVPISGLPAAATLTGSELVPIVQGGRTLRTTTADIASNLGTLTFATAVAASVAVPPPALASMFATQGLAAVGDGQGALYLVVSADPGAGGIALQGGLWGALVGVVASDGPASRTPAERFADRPNVEDWRGYHGDPSDTACVQGALDDMNVNGGGAAWISPKRTYVVNKLTIYPYCSLYGSGITSVIQLEAGANTDLIYGVDSNALFGTNTAGGAVGCGLDNLMLDGNRADQAAGSGSTIAIYAAMMSLTRLWVKAASKNLMHTDGYSTSGIDFSSLPIFAHLALDTCGQDGWLYNGLTDGDVSDIKIIDAGQDADNTYDGLHATVGFRGRNIHPWHRSTVTNRARYAGNFEGNGTNIDESHFEGANIPLRISGSHMTFGSTNEYYAARGGTTILLDGTCTGNQLRGAVHGTSGTRPVGVQYSSTASLSGNVIDLTMDGQATYIAFGTGRSAGNNVIRLLGPGSAGDTGYTGTPNAADDIAININAATTNPTLHQSTSYITVNLTPVMHCSTTDPTGATASTATLRLTKCNGWVDGYLEWVGTSKGTGGSGSLWFGDLPWPISAGIGGKITIGAVNFGNITLPTGMTQMTVMVDNNKTYIYFRLAGTGLADQSLLWSTFPDTGILRAGFRYPTDNLA